MIIWNVFHRVKLYWAIQGYLRSDKKKFASGSRCSLITNWLFLLGRAKPKAFFSDEFFQTSDGFFEKIFTHHTAQKNKVLLTGFLQLRWPNLQDLTLSWRRYLSYRNQPIDLLCKSMNWFLYDKELRHERVKELN